jgi:hypothetical protein
VDGASGFEDLAPSCGTGADGDYSDPGGLMTCGICLFPMNACICKQETGFQLGVANKDTFTNRYNSGDQRGGQPRGNKEAKSR